MDSMLRELRRSERLTTWLGNFLVAGMIACVAGTIANLFQAFNPAWQGGYLVPLSVVVSLETIYIQKIRESYYFPDPDWFAFHIIEWLAIALLVKVIEYLRFGGLFNDLSGYLEDFFGKLITPEFVIGLAVVVLSWFVSSLFAGRLIHLQHDEQLLQIELDTAEYIDRPAVRRNLSNLILTIGVILVGINSLQRMNYTYQWMDMPVLRTGGRFILVYFGLGLALLSLTQLTILRIRWSRQEVPMEPVLSRRWMTYAGASLIMLVLLAVVLPTNYTFGLLRLANLAINFFLVLAGFIFWLLSLPLFALSWLIALLAGSEPPESGVPPIAPLEIEPQDHPPGIELPILEILRSILFWGVLIGLGIYFLRVYILARRDQLSGLKSFSFFAWLGQVWAWFRSVLNKAAIQAQKTMQSGLERLRRSQIPEIPKTGGFVSLRRMDPRRRILFYYLALLRRSREKGYERAPAQTPYEYSTELINHLDRIAQLSLKEGSEADSNADILGMTEYFVEARYSNHRIESEQAGRMKQAWARVKKLLRLRRSIPESEKEGRTGGN